MPRQVIDLLVSGGGQDERGTIMGIWRLAPLCLMWCLWRQGNARSFKDVEIW
jgi:hypothetical protein